MRRTEMSDDSEFKKSFWEERAARARGEGGGGAPGDGKTQYKLNDDRKALLKHLLATQDWMDADDKISDPYTFAYCAQAGWAERRRKGGQLQFRITDEGIAVLHPYM